MYTHSYTSSYRGTEKTKLCFSLKVCNLHLARNAEDCDAFALSIIQKTSILSKAASVCPVKTQGASWNKLRNG